MHDQTPGGKCFDVRTTLSIMTTYILIIFDSQLLHLPQADLI